MGIEEKLDEIIMLLKRLTNTTSAREHSGYGEDATYAYFAATCDLLGATDEEVYQDYLDAKEENGDELPPVNMRKLIRAIKEARPEYMLKNTTWGGEQVRVWKKK